MEPWERWIGRRYGGFALERLLKSGGQGAVFAARREDGACAAIKIPRDLSDTARFTREAQLLRRLEHPAVVRLIDAGVDAATGVPYTATELLVGNDLEARLAKGALSLRDSLTLALQVCEALIVTHGAGVVHRDLKPPNLFLVDDDVERVKVLDFGIARDTTRTLFTGVGVQIGTRGYMSPEQVLAMPVDARADLWSLGAIFFECVTGRPLFGGGNADQLIHQIGGARLADLLPQGPTLPSAVISVIQRAVARSIDDRFRDAAELKRALLACRSAVLSDRDPHGVDVVTLSSPPTDQTPRPAGPRERRVVALVYLFRVRDTESLRERASAVRARTLPLGADSTLVVFGFDRWSGDEPRYATQFALETAALDEDVRIGIVTGQVERGAATVDGAALDAARRLAHSSALQVVVDDETAAFVEERFELTRDGAPREGWRVVSRRPRATAPLWRVPLIGRGSELEEIVRCVARRSTRHRAAASLVLGAPGMGKTRLAHAVKNALRDRGFAGTLVLTRCEDALRDSSYAALRDALSSDDELSLALRSVDIDGGDPASAIERCVAALIAALQRRSLDDDVLLILDDAQWIDPASLAVIERLVTSRDARLRVCAFARPDDGLVMRQVFWSTRIELDRLSDDDATQLLSAASPSAPTELVSKSEGIPFVLLELARLYARDARLDDHGALPVSVVAAQQVTLDSLSHPELGLLKEAAIFGRTAWLSGSLIDAPIRGLCEQELLQEHHPSRFPGTRELRFASDLLQEAAYGRWAEGARGVEHCRVAAWLESRPESAPAEVARHWELGGRREEAAAAYALAAELASRSGDGQSTRALTARVLELSAQPHTRWRALVARDHALQFSADWALQLDGLRSMEALTHSLGTTARLEHAWRSLYAARVGGARDLARSWGVMVRAMNLTVDDDRLRGAVANELAMFYAEEGRLEEAEAEANTAMKAALRRGDDWSLARAIASMGFVLFELGRIRSALDHFNDAAARYAACGDRRRQVQNEMNAAVALIRLGDLDEAVGRLNQVLVDAESSGNVRTLATALQNRATCRRMTGDFGGAAADLAAAGETAEQLRHARLRAAVAIERAYLEVSGWPVGHALREALLDESRRSDDDPLSASALSLLLRLDAQQGHRDPTLIEDATRRLATAGMGTQESRAELSLALWLVRGGEAGEAASVRALLAETLHPLPESDRPAAWGSLLARLAAPTILQQPWAHSLSEGSPRIA